MNRRAFLGGAQPARKVARIGILGFTLSQPLLLRADEVLQ